MAGKALAPIIGACEDCNSEIIKNHWRQKLCKECKRQRKRRQDFLYASARREEMAAKTRKWYAENRDRAKVAKQAYHAANAEKLAAYYAKYYRSNPEPAKKRAREWYQKNRERVLARARSEEGRKYSREKMRERLASEPDFKLHTIISRHIRASVKDKKRRGWESLLGYTCEELMRHLERQFLKGMN